MCMYLRYINLSQQFFQQQQNIVGVMLDRKRFIKNNIQRQTLASIDNYRNTSKDQTLYLKQEIAELKLRLSKYNQIEVKVQNLLLRDQQHSHELEVMRSNMHQKVIQNQDLKNVLELERLKKIQLQNTLKLKIQELMNEINWVVKEREQIQFNCENTIEQIKYKAGQQIQQLRIQFKNVQQQYEVKAERLGDIIKLKSNQIQQKQKEFNSSRLSILQQLQRISDKFQHTLGQNNFLKFELDKLKNRQRQLDMKNNQLSIDYQQLHTQKLKGEQQKAQSILNLKDQLKKLTFEFNDIDSKARIAERDSYQFQMRYKDMLETCDNLRLRIQDLQADLKKKNRYLQEYSNEFKINKEKNTEQRQKNISRINELQQQLLSQKSHTNDYIQKIQKIQSEVSAKTYQIKDLLYGIQRLQQKLLQFEQKNKQLQLNVYTVQEKFNYLLQQNQNLKLDVASFRQKLLIKENHIIELEQYLQQQQNLKQFKQKEIQQLKKYLSNPQQIVKKYEQEMLRMIQLFQQQKTGMQQKWNQQKNRLRQVYEYELKDKQDLYIRKVKLLEQQAGNKK